MPFNIVETVDARGHKELLAVPETWIQGTSKGKTYLLWPNVRQKDRLNGLIEDDNSIPTNSWERILCRVKRVGFSSVSEANEVVNQMCLETTTESSDVFTQEKGPQKAKQPRKMTNFESLLNLCEEENHEVAYKINKSALNENLVECVQSEMVDESEWQYEYLSAEHSEQYTVNEYVPEKGQKEPDEQLILNGVGSHKSNLDERLERIECALSGLSNRLTKVEKGMSTIIAKIDILTDKTVIPVSMRRRKNNNVGFEPIKNVQELKTFELDLSDNSYFNEIATWLENNMYENTLENRMIEIMDLIFTKQFLTECSWTGISKGKEKIALMTYKNVLELFRFYSSTSDSENSMRNVAIFFMKKLKNATKRATTKGLRKSTQHKF